MKEILRFFLFGICILAFTPIHAVITTQNCSKHTSDVMKVFAEITDLNDEQYSLLSNKIMQSCLENINKAENNTIENVNEKDWFTEKILSDDTSRKDGNKRLKKLK
tara:strand:+ start:1458 stop:1775 length:318 start_codon:yes stop_codon:yes gene_type:complete